MSETRNYRLLTILGVINFRWNCFVGWIHDLSARWGVGHRTVWFYDNFTWSLPTKWQLMGGVPYHEYVVRCELDTANHQINYYSNMAYELFMAELLQTIEDPTELVSDEPITTKKEIKNV